MQTEHSHQRRLMIVAGEPSGDAHAAELVHALREVEPHSHFEFFGATGSLMRDAGVESIVRSDDLAIMGIVEVGRVLPKFWRTYKLLKQAALEKKPDAVILVDWPDFNLRLARVLHRHGLKIIYYVSPQLWAWRSYRARSVRRDVDLLLTILPFEKDWFIRRGIKQVEFVGHPLAGEVRPRYGREEFCRRHELDANRPIISLLAGSRHKEVARILPRMLDAATLIEQQRPDAQFVLVVAPSRPPEESKEILASHSTAAQLMPKLRVVQHEIREALAASDVAAIASGTATLEAAIIGTPMVIVYKESPVNWHTLGRLINAEHYGLVNLVAGERVVTELMQTELSGERLAGELMSLLDDEKNSVLRKRLHDVAQKLGEGGASERAAQHVVSALDSWA